MELLIIIIVVVVVVLGGGGTTLLVGTRRRHRLPPSADRSTVEAATGEAHGATAVATPEAPPDEAAAPPGETARPSEVIVPPAETAAPPPVRPEVEKPPPSAGRLARLRGRLARSQSALGGTLLSLLSRDHLDDDTWDEIEETLITADMGVAPARQLVEELRTQVKVEGTRDVEGARSLLRKDLLEQVGAGQDRSLHIARHGDRPAIVLVVGVNGTGKTTTCGKLARVLIGDGHTVLLGAADTFRAAAADQLQTWGERVGAETVRADREGADPASVAFDAVNQGIERGVDVVIIDTAGRLHTKQGLMDELGKIKRVISRHATVDEVLLVLDATIGQNGLRQARVFAEVVDVTGVVLAKLDGTAKGGIVIAVQRELGVPVKLVGLGEGPDDLAPFEPETFVDAIISD
jgi:fused signal recognition particle receptor